MIFREIYRCLCRLYFNAVGFHRIELNGYLRFTLACTTTYMYLGCTMSSQQTDIHFATCAVIVTKNSKLSERDSEFVNGIKQFFL